MFHHTELLDRPHLNEVRGLWFFTWDQSWSYMKNHSPLIHVGPKLVWTQPMWGTSALVCQQEIVYKIAYWIVLSNEYSSSQSVHLEMYLNDWAAHRWICNNDFIIIHSFHRLQSRQSGRHRVHRWWVWKHRDSQLPAGAHFPALHCERPECQYI